MAPKREFAHEENRRAVEILELRYGDVSYNETREEEGQESVFPNLSNATSEVRAEIETPPATVTWSHQINLAVEEGVTLKVKQSGRRYICCNFFPKKIFSKIRSQVFNR